MSLIDDLRAFARVSQSSYAACEAMDKAASQLEAMQAVLVDVRETLSLLNIIFERDHGKQSSEIELQIRAIDASLNPGKR